jgi:hypothetical protein
MYDDIERLRKQLTGRISCEGCHVRSPSVDIEEQFKAAREFSEIESHMNHTKRQIMREAPGITLVLSVKGVPSLTTEATMDVLKASKEYYAFKWKGQ